MADPILALRREIMEAHALMEQDLARCTEHAIRAGKALLGARSCFPDAEGWEEWLRVKFAGSREEAAEYMRLAEEAKDDA